MPTYRTHPTRQASVRDLLDLAVVSLNSCDGSRNWPHVAIAAVAICVSSSSTVVSQCGSRWQGSEQKREGKGGGGEVVTTPSTDLVVDLTRACSRSHGNGIHRCVRCGRRGDHRSDHYRCGCVLLDAREKSAEATLVWTCSTLQRPVPNVSCTRSRRSFPSQQQHETQPSLEVVSG